MSLSSGEIEIKELWFSAVFYRTQITLRGDFPQEVIDDFVSPSCLAVAPGDSVSLQPSVKTKRRVVVRASEMSASFIIVDAPPYSYQGVP